MCGIIGILSKEKGKHIEACNSMIGHRGPDDNGIFRDGNLAFGHQRLSIIDLSEAGSQPMQSDDGSVTIIFNGEIYNHIDIRNSLKGSFNYKGTSDTETILNAYQEKGTGVFKDLNGIFALAIFDKRNNELIIARDHFGVKPLYYYHKNDELYFGSEIKSFLKIPGWDKSIDYTALVNYLHFLWSPGVQTPFEHVKKLLPGHFIKVDLSNPSKAELTQFYEIPMDGNQVFHSEEEWIEKLDDAFTKSVERQLLSDVPVGYFLSGGVDSSIIVAKAKELTGERVQCYTIDTDLEVGDKDGFTNDLYYAQRVAKHLDVKLETVPGKVDIVKDFDKMIWHLDEPQADAAPLNVLNICKVARAKGNTVLMGGAGGDDLFSGYRRHQAINFEKYFKWTPGIVGKGINGLAEQFSSENATIRRIQKLSMGMSRPLLDRLTGYYEWLPLDVNKSLFNPSIAESINSYDPADILKNSLDLIPNEKEPLNKLLFWDMKYFLADHNLNYTDKMSMAVGVEARVPFLDVDLVNMSAKVPVNLKMKGKEAKYLLKKMAEKYLPKDVIYRPKTGFGAPVRKWITNDLDEMINDSLSEKSVRERGIFSSSNITKLISDNKKGSIDASYSIWGLLAIESWMKQFVDK